MQATPRYTDPAASLKPVDEAVLAELALEITAADRNWEALRG
jgi:peptide/nickel transport system ATP-binding protein